jgi:hypothetical protein
MNGAAPQPVMLGYSQMVLGHQPNGAGPAIGVEAWKYL